MKTIAAPLLAHLQGERVTKAICWTVEKKTGGVIRGTEHDRSIEISSGALAGTYLAVHGNIAASDVRTTSDLQVDNLEVVGAAVESPDNGITVAEIEAGVLNGARVTVFVCNWREPDDGQVILRRGYMGEVTRNSDGALNTEIRGLGQVLSQNIGRILSDRCDVARFGDARCGFDVSTVTGSGVILSVTSRKEFVMQVTSPNPVWTFLPLGGEIAFSTGENAGFEKEVKSATFDGVDELAIVLFEEMPGEVLVGDGIDFIPGCDRTYTTCKLYENLVNFRGHGIFVPGSLAVMRGATDAGVDCEIVLPDGTSPP